MRKDFLEIARRHYDRMQQKYHLNTKHSVENSKIYAYGTPFSGKTDLNINACYPIKAIIFLVSGLKFLNAFLLR